MEGRVYQALRRAGHVGIQGVGSFRRVYISAHPDDLSRQISPPSEVIEFNQERQFDDGVLTLYLEQDEGYSHDEAEHIYLNWCHSLQKRLQKGQVISFHGIGTLSAQGGVYHFAPLRETPAAFLPHCLMGVEIPKEKIPTQPYRRSRRPLIVILIILLIVGVLALGSWYLWDVGVLERLLPQTEKKEIVEPTPDQPTPAVSSPVTTIPIDSLRRDSSHHQREALRFNEGASKAQQRYYIIAGSFNTLENAEKLCTTLRAAKLNPEILHQKDKYMVHVGLFTDKTLAFRRLRAIRDELQDEKIWLLRVNGQ